ncbi:MAG: methionine synthase, partial [Streptomycetaceae bacterium]|nr:methionine synthase [Streptomycetaceae bacterium]
EGALREVAAAAGVPVIAHSCAPAVPFGLLRRAGMVGISFDALLLTEGEYDAIGEAVEAGTVLFSGVVPAVDAASSVAPAGLSEPAGSVSGVRSLWRRLGLPPGALGESVVVTPVCGLAGASPAYARRALAHCVKAARTLVDNPE